MIGRVVRDVRGSNNGFRIATYGSDKNRQKGNQFWADICGAAVVFWEFKLCNSETRKN
jgi:hypothetical protein